MGETPRVLPLSFSPASLSLSLRRSGAPGRARGTGSYQTAGRRRSSLGPRSPPRPRRAAAQSPRRQSGASSRRNPLPLQRSSRSSRAPDRGRGAPSWEGAEAGPARRWLASCWREGKDEEGKSREGPNSFLPPLFFFLLERILKFQFMVAVEAGKKNVFFDLLFSSLSFFSPSLGYKSGRATNCELELSVFVSVFVAVWQRRSVTLSREKGKRRGERRASFALSLLVSVSRARSLLPPAAAASFHLALFVSLSLSFPEQPTAREAPPVPNLGVGRGAEATRKGRASERLSLFQRKGLAGLFFLFFFGRSLALLS